MRKNICIILGFLIWNTGIFGQSAGASFEDGPLMNSTRITTHIGQSFDGNYILFGGRAEGFVSSAYTDIYDAESNVFVNVNMLYPHDNAILIRLTDGRFFIAGGGYDLGIPAYGTIEYFNPSTNVFEDGGTLLYPRMMGSGVQLSNGKLLIVGGWYSPDAAANAELFDPNTGFSSYAGALISPRTSAMVLPCNDGGAVVFGGYTTYGGTMLTNVEYYDPVTNSFSLFAEGLVSGETGWFTSLDNMHKKTPDIFQLPGGKYVFVIYRTDPETEYALMTFDPATKTFEKIALNAALMGEYTDGGFVEMAVNRSAHLMYLLGVDKETADYTNVALVTVDLMTGAVYQPDMAYTLPAYAYMLYGNMVFIDDTQQILYAGISTAYNSYFYATSSTKLLTPEITVDVEPDAAIAVQVYPNPASTELHVPMVITEPASVQLIITDMTGRICASVMHHAAVTGNYIWQVPIAELPEGYYMLRVNSNAMSGSALFLKAHN